MKSERIILVVVFLICSFAVGTAFAAYEIQEPDWCVVDCGLSDTIGTGDYADGLDTGDNIGYRLDSSIGPLGEDDWEPALPSGTIVESGFYQVNSSSWVENPTFVFNDAEISSTTIKFKLQSDINPDWTQYAVAFSTGVNLSDLFTGIIYYIKKDGSIGTSFSESNDWNSASFYEGIELTGLNPNTIYGFKIKSRIPPPELLSTGWSGNTDNYTWTHIETPGISVQVYITSATVTAAGQFSNLGAGASGINFGIDGSYAGWTTATSHTFTNLNDNTSYNFNVKARNGKPYETNVVSTSKYTLCGPPRNPSITNIAYSSLTLSWSHSSLGAPDHYHIKENEVPIQDNYTLLSLDRANLENVNFRYTYKIYAVNQANETDEISSVSISAYTSCSIPPAPQILDVSADTSQITIDPGNNPWYTDFSIRVSGAGTTNFVQNDHAIGSGEVFNTAADWESPLTISTLLSNVEYDISVQAKNMSGAVTGYGTSVSSCTYAAVPGLGVVEVTIDSVNITIQEGDNSPPTEYAIYQEINMGGGWQQQGYLQLGGGTNPVNPVWQTKDDWGSGGFIVSGLTLSAYGFRWKAQARRTITGYSKKETNWSLYAYAGNVVITPTAAIGMIKLDAGTAYYYDTNQTVTFTAIGVDEIHYTYTTNGSDPADPTLSSPGGSPPVAFLLTALAGESKTYRIKAKAWQGTVESDEGGVWIVVIDRQPPTINSFNIVEKPYTTSQKITLSIWATDADYMKIEGDVTNAPVWIGYSNSRTVLLTEGAGNKTVSVTVKDEAGNESSPASDSIIYDPTPPNITGFRIEEGDYTDARQNMHLIEIDATAANLMWIDGDVENDSVTKEWIAYSDSAQVTLTSGDGPKTVTIKVANTVGTEAGPVSDTITLDTTPPQNPTLVLSDPDSPNPEYTNYEYVVVSITNLDTDVVEYILSETQATQPSATATWWPVPIPATYQLSPGDGEKKVYIWVKDVVNHINGGAAFDTVTLDTQRPGSPSLSIDGGPYANSQDVSLQISATGASSMWIDKDVINDSTTKEWINYNTSAQVTLTPGDGDKTITIKFRDEAGNETLPISYTITLEATPPVIGGDIEAQFVEHDTPLQEGIETGCQTPTFIWKATDTLSGVNGFSYSFSPVTTVQPDDTIDTTTDSVLLPLTTSYIDGTYYFKVKAMDNAGNFSLVESFVYEYKADSVSPEATIQVEGKERVGDEVKGVKANAIPEIDFTEEVWGANQYVQVELIRDNEGKQYENRIVSCEISSSTALLWKIDPGKDWEGNYTYRITAKDGVEDNAGNSLKEEKKLTFTTMLDRTKRNVVMRESDPKTKMMLEANALKENGYVSINLEALPLKVAGAREAKEVNEEAIIEADEKAKNNADIYCYNLRESMREISGYNTEGGKMVLDNFLNTVYLELPYGDSDKDGIVDSTAETSARVRVQTLSIYWLDEEHKLWVKVSGTKVDREKNVASARVIGFGTYTLMGGGFYDLADAYAYPVPYKPNDGLSTTGEETSGITFTNLSSDAEIKIYTITGELVKKLIHKTGFVKEWYPVENEKGEKVVSGVYIYYITNKDQHKSGKLVIIR